MKSIQEQGCQIKRGWFKPYTFQLTCDDKTYHVLQLNTHQHQQLTINSKTIWNIQNGKAEGARFITSSSTLLNLKIFLALDHPIIVLKKVPYRILKYINESEVVDITSHLDTYDIPIVIGKKGLIHYLKK